MAKPAHLVHSRNGHQFEAATNKRLGDLAWAYFYSQPIAKEIGRDPKDHDSLNHAQVHLLKGLDEDYAWLVLRLRHENRAVLDPP